MKLCYHNKQSIQLNNKNVYSHIGGIYEQV